MSTNRRGGIPGPDRRTGLVRPTMTEAEFERNLTPEGIELESSIQEQSELSGSAPSMTVTGTESDLGIKSGSRAGRSAPVRAKSSKPRRIQRMFAIEEDLDRKLWLYAIHMGKDRSEIMNDLLRPVVASMVVYDSRDRRGGGSVSGNSSLAESA